MLDTVISAPVHRPCRVEIHALLESAIQGLAAMFYPEKQIFCYRLKRTRAGLVKEGVSPRYTLITLMGLSRAEAAGLRTLFDINSILDSLSRNPGWMNNLGDLGLYLWLRALHTPDSLKTVIASLDLDTVLDRYSDARARRTMELSWFLSGLAHARLNLKAGYADITAQAFRAYHLLLANQGSHGIFAHLAINGSCVGLFRGRIGSFADQVYPIYALSKFAQAFDVSRAVSAATNCAEAICHAQGRLGQWWWHYDSTTGRAIGKHPVYSVHQDGMAPTALLSLSEATGDDFSQPIFRGLDWIAGQNELNLDLRDRANHVIWRSLHHNRYQTYSNELLNLAGWPGSNGGLKVKYECRPYHLGWLLYAFAGMRRHYA